MATVNKQLEMARYVARKIKKILKPSEYTYNIVYSGKSIEITSKDEMSSTRLYIRILDKCGEYTVDFSNILIDESIRHTGIFTALINEFKGSRKIYALEVSSVLTNEMAMACKKLGMRYVESIMGYRYVLR